MNAVDAAPKSISGLDISSTENGYIIYQPELDRVHYLNHSAILILELSNGRNSVREIAGLIQDAYGLPEPPIEMVVGMIAKLKEQGLLEQE
jgi:hypothetical protein